MATEKNRKLAHIVTFGCQMNRHDSEIVGGLLAEAGYGTAATPEAADVILFLTCCVRENAEQRLYSRISQLRRLKAERPDVILGVGGCVAQKEKAALADRFPHISIVFGPNAINDIVSLVKRAEDGEKYVIATPEDGPDSRSDLAVGRDNSRIHAWLSVMRGCNNYCSYCIVPYVRGRQRSKLPAEIVKQAHALASRGVVEITLLGQNVNSYGCDLDAGASFPRLLESLDETPGLLRIRFTTSHPKDLSRELMRAVADLPRICEHIHLPVQSGSSRILKMMNRGYTADEYMTKVEKLREIVPGISLTTDVIVGFPGETDDDFERTRLLFERVRFDGAYVFKYSPRSGTAAADYDECVDPETITHRHRVLLDCQKRISLDGLKRLVGTAQSILPESVDKKREGHLLGRTRGHRVAGLKGSADLIGTECAVHISRLDGWTLIGEAANNRQCEST